MREFKRWLVGFALITSSLTCTIDDIDSIWPGLSDDYNITGVGADCKFEPIEEIPDNLSADIKILALSGNHNLNLRKGSFQKYIELVAIEMSDMSVRNLRSPLYDESTFLPLKKLKVLKIAGAGFWHVKFRFPDSIESLVIDGNVFDELDISHLKNIGLLSITKCGLDDVPKIHESAPLTHLILAWDGVLETPVRGDHNPMTKVTAESLSSYCSLQSLMLNMTLTPPITLENFCRCCRLNKWLSFRIKEGRLPSDHIVVYCGKDYKETECSFDFTSAIANRENCLIRHSTSSSPTLSPAEKLKLMRVILSCLLILMLIVMLITYVVWAVTKSDTSETEEEEVSLEVEITEVEITEEEITEEEVENS